MDQVKIGKFIAELRRKNKMTQEALGEKIGVTNKTISRWENGNYMPDIEMLQLLGRELHVNVNELLCGERLTDVEFREEVDKNLVSVWKSNRFSLEERIDFWKKKWMKEHISLIAIYTFIVLAVFAVAWIQSLAWLSGIGALIAILLYAVLRNIKIIYVEGRAFISSKVEG